MKVLCILSNLTKYIDGYLIKKKKTFTILQKIKLVLYKKFFKNPPKISQISKKNKSDIVASLTVINSRIDFLNYTINSLLHQTLRIKKIIINFDKTLDKEKIEFLKKKYNSYAIEFRLVEDYGSHKKYLFLNEEERSSRVLLCDDDIIYDKWVLEDLLDCLNKNIDSVATLIGFKMSDNNGNLVSRENWKLMLDCNKGKDLFFFTGNAFTLYPPNFFYGEILSKNKILKYCKNPSNSIIGSDDSWCNYHRIKKEITVFYARPYSKFTWPAFMIDQDFSLGKISNRTGLWWEGRILDNLINNLKNTKYRIT